MRHPLVQTDPAGRPVPADPAKDSNASRRRPVDAALKIKCYDDLGVVLVGASPGTALRDIAGFQESLSIIARRWARQHPGWLVRFSFVRADLSGADLRLIDPLVLRGVMFSHADLRRANLERLNLGGADLSCAQLDNARLAGADLRNADLRGVTLEGADLGGARLTAARAHRAIASQLLAGGAVLEDVRWEPVTACHR